MRNTIKTTRQVAEEGIYRPSSTSGGGGAALLDGIVFRPGGIAGGNVFATWASAFSAATGTSDTTRIYVDDTIAPAIIPSGVWDFQGALTLDCFDLSNFTRIQISDGATLRNVRQIDNLFVDCACVTTHAFDFSYPAPNNTSFFFLFDTVIAFLPGANVSAIVVPAGDFLSTDLELSQLDSTNFPGGPMIQIAATGSLEIFAVSTGNQAPLLATGNEIGGPAGALFDYEHDDTLTSIPVYTGIFWAGTYTETLASQLVNAGSKTLAGPDAPVGAVATADGAGNVEWAVVPPASVPTRGLTLSFQANSDVFADAGTGRATAWGNLATPGSGAGSQGYWTSQGLTAPAITANINGTPSLTVVNADAPDYKALLATTMDYVVGPGAEFSYAGSLKYNGNKVLNLASLRTMPLVLGCETASRTWGVCTALDGGGQLRIVVFHTPDDVNYFFVESTALDPTLPHYFVVTFLGSHTLFTGVLNLYVDQLAVASSAPVQYPTLVNTQTQPPRMFSSAISTNTRQDCDLGEFHAWQVALNATEVAAMRAFLRANGNYP